MGINFQYKPPETTSGALRTPVKFLKYAPDDGPEPSESKTEVLHECFAEVYSPSMKDIQILQSHGSKEAATIRIRDTKGEYVPINKHFVEIDDYRYKDKLFNVIDVRYDLTNNDFITILLECSE